MASFYKAKSYGWIITVSREAEWGMSSSTGKLAGASSFEQCMTCINLEALPVPATAHCDDFALKILK